MISIIAAIGKNNELGKNNSLIWNLPNDLIFFKQVTLNHPVVMGFKTYKSIGRPLPDRKNIVLSNQIFEEKDIIIYNDINELTNFLLQSNEDCFIIGGASLYNYYYPLADKMYLTLIDATDNKADVYFPTINYNEWEIKIIGTNNDNGITYQHVEFIRKRTK